MGRPIHAGLGVERIHVAFYKPEALGEVLGECIYATTLCEEGRKFAIGGIELVVTPSVTLKQALPDVPEAAVGIVLGRWIRPGRIDEDAHRYSLGVGVSATGASVEPRI